MKDKQGETAKPNPSRLEIRQARIRAVVLATATVIAILFFMFGQIQKLEAEKSLELAKQSKAEAEKQRELLEAEHEKTSMLTQQLAVATQSLEECQKKK